MKRSELVKMTALLGVLSAVGCAQDDGAQDDDIDLKQTASTFAEYASQHERDALTGLYVVEEDMLYDEAMLRTRFEAGPNPTALLGNIEAATGDDTVVPRDVRQNISYCVSNAFGANKQAVVTALANATADWQSSTEVRFVYVSAQDSNCVNNNYNVFFNVVPAPTTSSFSVRSFFPTYPRDWRVVQVNPLGIPTRANGVSLTGIMRHEVGHLLGFRHEHERDPACAPSASSDPRPPGVPALPPTGPITDNYDVASIMIYPTCPSARVPAGDLQLTWDDRIGASCMYNSIAFFCPNRKVKVRLAGTPGSTTRVSVSCDANWASCSMTGSQASTGCTIDCPLNGNVTFRCERGNGPSQFDNVTLKDNWLDRTTNTTYLQLKRLWCSDRTNCSVSIHNRTKGIDASCAYQ